MLLWLNERMVKFAGQEHKGEVVQVGSSVATNLAMSLMRYDSSYADGLSSS